jgi:glutamate/tyrosine decarboxylase-like PLP-dependent enzyme
LNRAWSLSERFLGNLNERRVGPSAGFADVRARLARPLDAEPEDPTRIVEELAEAVEPGLVATAGPRYFGFVIGGSVPAALAADQLVSVWDQNAALARSSPAAAAVESVVSEWLLDVLALPRTASVGFVTGCQMANFTCLAAARHAVLERAGWDVERDGLQGGPRVSVVVGEEAHATIHSALRYVGLGSGRSVVVPADGEGRMRPDGLRRALASLEGPTIVCAQAGNVNTGAFDPLDAIADATAEKGAWLHVDGAFGLWAAASADAGRRALARGADRAQSWATDAHKWLNVPYDSGLAIVASPAAHRGAMTKAAAYLIRADGAERDPHDFTPESSRRARGFAIYAGLRNLGRRGLSELVERCCALAVRAGGALRGAPGVVVLNEVVLNQVLVRFAPPNGDPAGAPSANVDAHTRAVVERVQREGVAWLGGTRWRGMGAMRISVSNWTTTDADVDALAASILRAHDATSGNA